MTLFINDKTIELPESTANITLGQRISFYEEHGRALDEILDAVGKMEAGPEKDLEIVNYNYERMVRVFAFIAGVEIDDLKESEFIDVVATIYYNRLALLFEDKKPTELKIEFEFKGDQWILSEPELKNGSLMSFGEFIDAKQLVKDMIDNGAGKWHIVQYLAAIYLRKKGEIYKEELLFENSDRLKLMEQLPMDIASQVDFFLSSTTNFWKTTLKYFERAGQRDLERMYGIILSNTAGSIFLNQSQPRKSLTLPAAIKTASIVPVRLN